MQRNLKKLLYKEKKILKIHVRVIITETVNNMFFTIAKINGKVIYKASIGLVCKKLELEQRKTPLAAELLGVYIGEKMVEQGFIKYSLIISHFIRRLRLVRSALKGLMKSIVQCQRICVLERLAHNGIRLAAMRRK